MVVSASQIQTSEEFRIMQPGQHFNNVGISINVIAPDDLFPSVVVSWLFNFL